MQEAAIIVSLLHAIKIWQRVNELQVITFDRLILLFVTYVHAEKKEDLTKEFQNPVGNIISLPIEYWHYDGMANDSSADALVIKPVYPLGFEKVTLINRFIVPFLGIDANVGGSDLGISQLQ